MSKTDKTNPVWVGREWEAVHGYACELYVRNAGVQPHNPRRLCNLPPNPPRRWLGFGQRGRGMYVWEVPCYWEPILPSAYRGPSTREWPRPRAVRENANKIERRIRTEWRDHRQKLLASRICVEGTPGCCCLHDLLNEDHLVPPDPRHRNYALWDMW